MYKEGIIKYAKEMLKHDKYTYIIKQHQGVIGIEIEIEILFKNNNLKGYFTGSKMLIKTKNNFTTVFTQGIPTKIKEIYTKTKEGL